MREKPRAAISSWRSAYSPDSASLSTTRVVNLLIPIHLKKWAARLRAALVTPSLRETCAFLAKRLPAQARLPVLPFDFVTGIAVGVVVVDTLLNGVPRRNASHDSAPC